MTFKKAFRFILLALVVALPWVPLITFARIVPTCGDAGPGCEIEDFVELANNVMRFLINLCIGIFVLGIAVVGFKFITANGNEGEIKKAKEMVKPLLLGFALILCAFLIVKLLLSIFAQPSVSKYLSVIY